jgi:hypothetical protein
VLLNDAVEAANLSSQWAREDHAKAKPMPPASTTAWEAEREQLETQLHEVFLKALRTADFKRRAAADMEKAGLKVTRVAGRFTQVDAPRYDAMNFLNGESATGQSGKPFFMTNGGDPRAERYFAQKLMNEVEGGPARVYFADRELSRQWLQMGGGLNCRIKWEGDTVVPKSAPQPPAFRLGDVRQPIPG